MIDVFHAIHECGDLIDYWDVTRRSEGVLVRARSRLRYLSEDAATETASVIAARIRPQGYEISTINAMARADRRRGPEWHAYVEVVIA